MFFSSRVGAAGQLIECWTLSSYPCIPAEMNSERVSSVYHELLKIEICGTRVSSNSGTITTIIFKIG